MIPDPNPHANHTAQQTPARPASPAPRKSHTLAAPIKRAPAPAPAPRVASRFFNIHTVQWSIVRLVFLGFLFWWLWTDGPQGYRGTEAWMVSIARLAGHIYSAPWHVTLVAYIILTAITNFLWIFVAAWWDWLTDTWGNIFFIVIPVGTLVLFPLTGLDVMKSAAGWYTYFAPLDLANPHWWLAWGSLAEAFAGSVGAQLITMIMLRRWGQSRKARKG